MKKESIIVYTDGASRGNPGPGGWAAVILAGGYAMEIAGGVPTATNNQMELEALRQVLIDSGAKSAKEPIVIYSDSAYVVNGFNSWIHGWERKGWKTINKTPVENRGLWEELLSLKAAYGSRLTVGKVSGHAGELYNERCDELAVAAALGKLGALYKGSVSDYDAFLESEGTTAKKGVTKKKKSDAPAYSYVSFVDGKVHADKTWAACEKRVKGKKGAKYKKVFSKEEETALVQDYTLQSLL